jgi:bifunctional DNase/RNase
MERRDYARAGALARSALAHYPDFVLAHYLLGEVALAEGQWEEAAGAFRHVLEQYPGSLAAHEALRAAVERLEPTSGTLTITFAADSHEAVRLGRVVQHGPQACHPIFDFVRALLSSLEAGVTRVVLEDVQGEGISGIVYVGAGGSELPVPCYPPDAIALALRAGIPIYATQDALTHAEPSPTPPPGAVSEWLERVRPSDFRQPSDEA